MTVATTSNKVTWYGNGIATSFPYKFLIPNITELSIFVTDASGAVTPLTASQFSISGLGDPNGGAVSYPLTGAPLPQGYSMTALRTLPIVQQTDITNQDGFYPDVVEACLDYLTMVAQQLNEQLSRALTFPISDPTSVIATLPAAGVRAGQILGFDPSGNAIGLPLPASIGAGDMHTDLLFAGQDFTPGESDSVTLSREYGTLDNIQAFFDIGYQAPNQLKSLTGNQLVFASVIPEGVEVIAVRGGTTMTISIPPAGSVGPEQLGVNVVGDGQLAWGGILTRVVNSQAAVSALDVALYQQAFATGYGTPGDLGGGPYTYSATSTAPINGATVLAAAGGVGRWLWTLSDTPSVCLFGAALNGTQDDTAAFNNGLAACGRVRVPFTPAGTLINGTVIVGTGQWVEFDDPNMTVYTNASSSTGNPFRLTGYGDLPMITSGIDGGCMFNMNGAPAGSTAIRFGTSTGVVWGVRLKGRFGFFHCYEAIGDEASDSNYVTDIRIDDVFCRFTQGRQIYIRRSRGFTVFNDIYIDQSANPADVPITWEGARFEDFIGLEINRFDVATGGLGTKVYQPTVVALVINGTGQSGVQNASVWLNRVLIDNTFGNGVVINNVLNLVVDKLETYQNLGYGMQLADVTVAQIDKLFCNGASGVTGAAAGQIGVTFSSCDQIQLGKLISNNNTSDGVYLHNTTRVTVAGWETHNNENIGWVEDGTSNFNIKSNGISYGNSISSLSQIGAASACLNWIADAGAFRASDVGTVIV